MFHAADKSFPQEVRRAPRGAFTVFHHGFPQGVEHHRIRVPQAQARYAVYF